jgi:hypothetical protein
VPAGGEPRKTMKAVSVTEEAYSKVAPPLTRVAAGSSVLLLQVAAR